MKRECIVCGREFDGSHNALYCSEDCKKKKTPISDHVGETWGELNIIAAYRQNGRIYATCKCSCGKIFDSRYDSISSGKTTSCGHLTQFQSKIFAGKENKYGITAIRFLRKGEDSPIWECKCYCGKLFEVQSRRFSQTKSCGCRDRKARIEQATKLKENFVDPASVENTNIFQISEKKMLKNNTSGIRGVSWDSHKQKWLAQIRFKGKNYHLGRYVKKEDAAKARKEAEENLFGNFLEYYQKTFPDRWEALMNRKKGKK